MTDIEQLIHERAKNLYENTDFPSTLFESLVGYAIIAADFDGNVIAYNEGARHIYGYTHQEIIGRENIEIFFPKDFIEAGKLQRAIEELIGKGKFSYEGGMVRKNGEKFPAQVLFTLTKDKSGNIIGFIVIAEDLTERKKAEEALRKLSSAVEQTWDIIYITNKDGIIEYVNPAFEKVTGYTKEEAVGKTPRILKSGEHGQSFYEELWKTILSGEVFRGELINKKKSGELYYTEKTITPIKDEKGNAAHFVSIEKDITERKKAEELRLENERLLAITRAKSEFLATMSHELRTPLNAIIGFSELLKQKTELNEKQEHYIENVHISGKHLLKLINDILDLSKVEAGKIELVIEKISVPEFIDETLILMKEKAARHNVVIKKEFDLKLDFIEADKLRFKQVLFNLLDNAVKFSKPEGVVTITTKKVEDMAQFSVSDKGIGVKEQDMEKLFKEFVQIDSGISRKYGGAGLGLAITKQLVELHGGRIWAESKYGEGSTFTFMLPLEAGGGGG